MSAMFVRIGRMFGRRAENGRKRVSRKDIRERRRNIVASLILAGITIGVFAAGYAIIGNRDLIGDEWAHFKEAKDLVAFFETGAPFVPVHPAIPGYHLYLAVVAMVTGIQTLPFLRAVSLVLSALSVWMFYKIMRLLDDRPTSLIRSVQYLFFPLLFPFFFLLYTDIASVFVTLLALHQTITRRYWTGGLLAGLSVAVRQNNVIWIFFFLCLMLIQEGKQPSWRAFATYARHSVLYVLSLAALGIFIIINHGAALADRSAQPSFELHTGNMFTLCVFFFAMFFPLVVLQPKRLWQCLVRCRGWVFGAVIALFFFYLWTYTNTHPYNFDQWWLRNKVLVTIMDPAWRKSVYFLFVLLTILIFSMSPFYKKRFLYMYPFSILYLSSSWLIEPRYFFVPLVFFQLLRKPASRKAEIGLLVVFVIESAILFYGAWKGLFLP